MICLYFFFFSIFSCLIGIKCQIIWAIKKTAYGIVKQNKKFLNWSLTLNGWLMPEATNSLSDLERTHPRPRAPIYRLTKNVKNNNKHLPHRAGTKYRNNICKEMTRVWKLGLYLRKSGCCFFVFIVILIVTERVPYPKFEIFPNIEISSHGHCKIKAKVWFLV